MILLFPPAFWNITDFGGKCEKCAVTNTTTLEQSESKNKQNPLSL